MQWTSGARRITAILSLLVIFVSSLLAPAAQAQTNAGVIKVTAVDESEKPVSGAVVELKLKGAVVGATTTNDKGEAEFTKVAHGTYEVGIAKDTFEPLTQTDLILAAGASVEVKFTMIPKVQLKDVVVNVNEKNEDPLEKGGARADTLLRADV